MINIKNISIKNFMSVGNVSQGINFTASELVLVLGENLDMGGNDSRNGVGKSTILNAISYALYGDALVRIKKDNLINKLNVKGMVVTLEFEKNGINYRIERGRKPNLLKFFINDKDLDATNEAQGENRLTQEEIERVVAISQDMFKHIVALNTHTEPFLSMGAGDQRSIIEQLLGITQLSEKADKLKVSVKEVKDGIKEEEFRMEAIKNANGAIEKNIATLKVKSSSWEASHLANIRDTNQAIEVLSPIDIKGEIQAHEQNANTKRFSLEAAALRQQALSLEKECKLYTRSADMARKNLHTSNDKTCPTCEQEMGQDTHRKVQEEYSAQLREAEAKIKEKELLLAEVNIEISKLVVPDLIDTVYKTVDDAYGHKASIEELENNLIREQAATNPYLEQVLALEADGIQVVDYEMINTMTTLKEHQDFLLNLLTNKDSFIRKKIIEQNLLYLNSRLAHYLSTMGLPHAVRFQSDLEVSITQYGRDFDFDNLSRGEKTRLILSLSLAFRDVYENLNGKINLLFVDELIDNGLDTAGVENALAVFKAMTREQSRNIFLISHRDELVGRVSSVLKVVKEGGFTSFSTEETHI